MTVCTRGREPVLSVAENAERIIAAMVELDASGDGQFLAGTVMPDHIHLLFVLGERLTLARIMAKVKSRARRADAPWRWQGNSFEH